MNPNSFIGINYSQHLNTCVLASYAVACFPFTTQPVGEYFVAYCRHFKLDETHPERCYEQHFHKLASKPGNSGYSIIKSLHDSSDEPEFIKARSLITLETVDWSQTDTAAVERNIKQEPDCLLLLFINASNFPGLTMHSIVLGHDGQHLYYFDTAPGAVILCNRHGIQSIANFGNLGDAFIIRKII